MHSLREAKMNKLKAENAGTPKNGVPAREPSGTQDKPARRYLGVREWQAKVSLSRLFRTSTRLQTAFDRSFSQYGMTAQEAAVLVHCAEEGGISAGKLAAAVGRDKGKITRSVDRLKRNGFLIRKNNPRDHRLQIISATNKGRRLTPYLKIRFEEVRAQFFEGVQNADMGRLEDLLSQLQANAERLCETTS
jgi:DNA-binding MarR family transcriptional regulator